MRRPVASVEDADKWLDSQVEVFRRRPFAELAMLPTRMRLEPPPHLAGYRFTMYRTKGLTGGVEIKLHREAPGVVGWVLREFEKFPNESFDEATMPRPHTIADLARDVGHFECHLRKAEIGLHRRPSEMSLNTFRRLGLHQSTEIHAFSSVYENEPRDLTRRELARLGQEHGGGWQIAAPSSDNEPLWRKLLETAMPLVLRAPEDPAWLAACISRLHRPAVIFAGVHESERGLRHVRRSISSQGNVVLVALGLYRDVLSFCGRGPLFEGGLAAMMKLPDPLHGPVTDLTRREYLKGAVRVVPRKA